MREFHFEWSRDDDGTMALEIQSLTRVDRGSPYWRRICDKAWVDGYTAGSKGRPLREVPFIDDELYGAWFAGYARGEQERGWQG